MLVNKGAVDIDVGGDVPVVHSGLLFVCEGLKDVVFFALGELRHEVDEGGHEYKASERVESVLFLRSRRQ